MTTNTTRPFIPRRVFERRTPSLSMEANFLTRALTRPRCNFVISQRVFSRAQSTVSKAKPATTAGVEPKPQTILTWPDYLAIRHSKRKWQMVKRIARRVSAQRVTNSTLQAAMVPCAFLGFVGGAAYFGTLDADPMKPIMVLTLLPWSPFSHPPQLGY